MGRDPAWPVFPLEGGRYLAEAQSGAPGVENSVDGIVLGPVVQAGTVHGSVMVGAGNTQIIASYNTYYNVYNGTWTDGVAPPPVGDATGAMSESPYRGLATFGEQDSGFFFGRDDAAGQVLDRMAQRLSRPGLLMTSGVSGAGKSSLLRAAVIPRIRRNGLAGAPEVATWPLLVLTPGRAPLAGLAGVAALAGIDAATTHQALKNDPADFALTARQVAESRPAGDRPPDQNVTARRMLLIVDQFEQLFIQCPNEGQRTAFLTALHAAATAGDRPPALVVLVVRADFEARCAGYPLLAEAVQDRYLVNTMTERQLRMVITEPAKKANSSVDDDLVTVLLDDIRGRAPDLAALAPGLGPVAPAGILPLLSHVLDTAWRTRAGNSLTVADYERAGGIERAVAASAEQAFDGLTPTQQDLARTTFLRLIATSPDGTVTADRATLAELRHGRDAAQIRDVDEVLEAFARERLLTLAADTVEISHEVLLRAWPLLRDEWLDGSQADRIVRTRLRAAAGEWDRCRRDPSYLYAGSLLQDAVTTVARVDHSRQPDLSPTEQEFLHASTRARRRTVAVRRGALAALLALTLGLATTTVAAYQASQTSARHRDEAAHQRDTAIASQLVTESEAQADTNPEAAKIKSLAAWRIDPTPQTRYALISAAIRPNPGRLFGWDHPVNSVAFSVDRTMLAESGSDGKVRLWNTTTLQQIGHPITPDGIDRFVKVAFSPDGRTLATGDTDGVQLWNVATQQPIDRPFTTGATGTVDSMAFSPDGKILAIGEGANEVRLWNVATHSPVGHLRTVGTNLRGVAAVAFSPDSRTLATGGQDGTVQLWNVATQQQIGHPVKPTLRPEYTNGVLSMAFSPDGATLVTSHQDHTVRLWNIATLRQLGQPITADAAGNAIAITFSPNGRTFATGHQDNSVRLWDTTTLQQLGEPFTFTDASHPGFYTVGFSPDGQSVAIGIQDGVVWWWTKRVRLPLATTSTVSGATTAEFSSDGQTLATGSDEGLVQLWNVATQHQLGASLIVGRRFLGTSSLAFSPDSQTLATGGDDGMVRLWSVATQHQLGAPLTVGTEILGSANAVAFSPDGRILATGSDMGTVQLWSVATQQQLGAPLIVGDFSFSVSSVAFSPDGRTLATGSDDGNDSVRLWDVATRRQIGGLSIAAVDAVAFSPDGRTLATGSQNGTARLWDVATEKQIGQPLTGGTGTTVVGEVAFSPDGRTLATGSQNGTARLWDVATQQQIGQPVTGTAGANAVTFRPNGRTFATATADGIAVWDANQIVDPLAHVCDQIGGYITPDQWSQYVPAGPTYNNICP